MSVGEDLAYVQFGDGSFRCFDLALDPTWRTECHDGDRVLHAAQEQLLWRQRHLRHELTDMLLTPGPARLLAERPELQRPSGIRSVGS